MSERRYLIDYLKSDLYERVEDRDPETGMTWRSPLKWCCRISGDRDEPVVEIWNDLDPPERRPFWGPDFCRLERLDRVLP